MNQFHLTKIDNSEDYSIKQGAYYSFTIHYPELDLSTWGFGAQIRLSFLSEEILTSFNFLPVVYGLRDGKEGNWSSITVYLNASQTRLLPVTKNRVKASEPIKEGTNVIVYDVEATDPLDADHVIKLIEKSYIEVIGEITR
jgi:hypothetical protein